MQLRASHRGGCARTMRPRPRRPHGGRLSLAHTLTTFSYGIRRGFGRGGYRRFRGSVLAGRLREVLRQEAGAFRGERFSGALRGDSIGKTESAPGGVIWKEEGALRKLPFFVSKKGKSRTAGEIIDNFLCFFKKLWTAAAGYDILKQSGRGQDVFLVGGGIWYTKTERPKPLRKRFVSFVWKSVSLPSI